MSYRIPRLNSEMQKCISEIIRNKLDDPRIDSMVSVLAVSVAKDLKTAKVTISASNNGEETLLALKSAAAFIKREVSLTFKNIITTPELSFILDTSLDYSARINKLLDELKHDK
jgi:ribosome-binding factor A